MTIRPARPGDVHFVTAIYGASVRDETASWETEAPSLAEMQRRYEALTEKGYPFLVGEEAGVVVGFAYAGPFRQRAAYDWSVEDSVYVHPTARGRGMARRLLEALIEACEARGDRAMLAVIGGAENEGSIRLHERCGFTHAGRIPSFGYKHERWLDLVLMHRQLGEGDSTPPKERA